MAAATVREYPPGSAPGTDFAIGISLAELPGLILADVCELGGRLDQIGMQLVVTGSALSLEYSPTPRR
ncbi:hypothetical protein [Deinococcus rufus]|uniref:Uncharacterized protein n=1 Tax=Deinococcus rufus TaxID=2136097 RepID=A0ABV7ZBL7_9DEIO